MQNSSRQLRILNTNIMMNMNHSDGKNCVHLSPGIPNIAPNNINNKEMDTLIANTILKFPDLLYLIVQSLGVACI